MFWAKLFASCNDLPDNLRFRNDQLLVSREYFFIKKTSRKHSFSLDAKLNCNKLETLRMSANHTGYQLERQTIRTRGYLLKLSHFFGIDFQERTSHASFDIF